MIGNLWNDLRYGVRMLSKSPIFTTVAVVTLTLGIGANTVIFSLVNALLFRPLPAVHEPDQLTYLSGSHSYPDYEYFRDHNEVFSGLLAQGGTTSLNLNTGVEPELVVGELVTANFFSVLGVPPAMGRAFLPEEDRQPGAHPVAVLSYGLWQRRFGSDGDIVGKTVQLNGLSFTIVGVMPQGFAFPTNEELWTPLYTEYPPRPRGQAAVGNPALVGLLRREVSLDQASAEFATFAKHLAEAYPATNKQFNAAQVEPLIVTFTPTPLRGTLWTMLAFCVGVLLIACVNVMNMQFARATLRGKELAIRSSLGARLAPAITRGRTKPGEAYA